jgi:hypothetical protein
MDVAVDADILQYEVAFAAEAYWKYRHKEMGKEVEGPPPFDVVEEMLLGRLEQICEEAGGEKPLLFFTGKNNYRNHLAKTNEYKNRETSRPFHYKNVKAYLQSRYEWEQQDWFEADDLIKLKMLKNPGKYICASRDKDLHQIPGTHYGWELGHQPAFGPMVIDQLGFLKLIRKPKGTKLLGGGEKYFYAQMLMGDRTDCIEGIDGMGNVTAFTLLSPLETIDQLQATTFGVYVKAFDNKAVDRFLETGNLLRMAEDVDEDFTQVKLWNPFISAQQWMDVKTGEIIEKG